MRYLLPCVAVMGIGAAAINSSGPAPRPITDRPTASVPLKLAGSAAEKIRGDLDWAMANATENGLVRVTIVLTERADRNAIIEAARIPNKTERRAAVIALLKDFSVESQASLMRMLERAQRAGDVGEAITPLWIANVVGASVSPDMVHRIAARQDIESVTLPQSWDFIPDGLPKRPAEPFFAPADEPGGAGLDGNIECGVEIMGAPLVWDVLGITGTGAVVGVIDTGCCWQHPDLINQVWTNTGEIPGNGIDDDNNGFIDDIHGWSWDNNGSSSNINDTNGHGTHVIGTVAGDGTNGTVTGMAPDCQFMVLKFWNDFSGEASVWSATQYGVENGADVLSASLGWPHSFSPQRSVWRDTMENAMAAGVVVTFAAGNEGVCCGVDSVRTPGDVPDMITVGATDCSDNIASFSSRGPVTWETVAPYFDWPHPPGKLKPTISAPGVNTISTSNNCSGYRPESGTSMATPHVAGAIALILSANPNLDHWQVKQILKDTAVDLGSAGPDNTFGAGRVNVFAAVEMAMSMLSQPASPIDVTTSLGIYVSGGLAEIGASDDSYYVVQTGPAIDPQEPHPAQVEIGFDTAGIAAVALDITIEERANIGGPTAVVLLRDFTNGGEDEIGRFSVGPVDSTMSFAGIAAADYVSGGNRIEVHVRTFAILVLNPQVRAIVSLDYCGVGMTQ